MPFQRRGGRKRIVAPDPDGGATMPTTKPQPGGTLVKALARAWPWQRMLDDGVYASVSEIGEVENISKSYVSPILRLALLAPDMVESILSGCLDHGLMLELLERPLPWSWEEQRRRLMTVFVAREAFALAPQLRCGFGNWRWCAVSGCSRRQDRCVRRGGKQCSNEPLSPNGSQPRGRDRLTTAVRRAGRCRRTRSQWE
jgi:hypothetical protein